MGLDLDAITDRVIHRMGVQFRLAAAGRLTGTVAEALAAEDQADEKLMNAAYAARMAARGLDIFGQPIDPKEYEPVRISGDA